VDGNPLHVRNLYALGNFFQKAIRPFEALQYLCPHYGASWTCYASNHNKMFGLKIKWHFDGFVTLYVKALENLLDLPRSVDVEKTMPLISFHLHA